MVAYDYVFTGKLSKKIYNRWSAIWNIISTQTYAVHETIIGFPNERYMSSIKIWGKKPPVDLPEGTIIFEKNDGTWTLKTAEPGDSIALNIQLPYEQRINAYVEKGIGFHYFFVRKVMLSYAARAYVFFPGGFGTLDEFFEIITLIQTKKIQAVPVVLVGKEYWGPLTSWIKEQMHEKFKAIDEADQEIYKIVDTAEEVFEIVKDAPVRSEFSEFICPSGPESG